jgi:lysophospholipase L1-like esterase
MQGHWEKMLSKHCRVRQNMKGNLVRESIINLRGLDTWGGLTHTTNTSEKLAALEHLPSKDNVHLTEEGYKAMAASLLKEATSL